MLSIIRSKSKNKTNNVDQGRVSSRGDAILKRFLELSSEWYWEQDDQYRFSKITGDAIGKIGLEAQIRLERLAKAVEINDSPAVAGEAHSIKGASKNISAKALSDTSDRLELAGKHADHDSKQSLVAQLTAGFYELKTTWSEIRSLI